MMTSRRTIFIFLLGASVGLVPFLLSGVNFSYNPQAVSRDATDSYVRIAERGVQEHNDQKRSHEQASGVSRSETGSEAVLRVNSRNTLGTDSDGTTATRLIKAMPVEPTENSKPQRVTRTNLLKRWQKSNQELDKDGTKPIGGGSVGGGSPAEGLSVPQLRNNLPISIHKLNQERDEDGTKHIGVGSIGGGSQITDGLSVPQLRNNLPISIQKLNQERDEDGTKHIGVGSIGGGSQITDGFIKETERVDHKRQTQKQVLQATDEEDYGSNGDNTGEEIDQFFNKLRENTGGQRKILLDCGGNMASTVDLFQETYPGGREYIIHSFEIDTRLGPYFNPYPNHHLHCPVGVAAKDGNMTAFTETAWSPTRGKNNGRDMQWGGGTLFVSKTEADNTDTGGKRLLNVRPTIPVIDLSSWIQTQTSQDDYVIFKLDVEGAEYDILKKMLADGTFKWIDKYYGEFHPSQPVEGWSKAEKTALQNSELKKAGQNMIDWQGEHRSYSDFDKMHPVQVPLQAQGTPGGIYSSCGNTSKSVALALAVGMNAKRARKVIETISAYHHKIPLTLFLYGDYAELFPNDVIRWRTKFDIGIREDGHFPAGHFAKFNVNWIRESLVSAELRLQELDVQPAHYLPLERNQFVVKEAQKRGFRVIDPTYEFPPKKGTTLEVDNYYKYRDVERIPKALRNIHQALFVESHGGFLVLDTDLPDTRMNIVFLLDYLVENSGYKLVSVADCVALSVASEQHKAELQAL